MLGGFAVGPVAVTRRRKAPVALLDDDFTGVLVSDFYAGYSPLGCRKQRCWGHYLRDLKELLAQHPETEAFMTAVRLLYREATTVIAQPGYAHLPETERVQHRLAFEARAVALATPSADRAEAPERVLAQRILTFQTELFVFVECPRVPAENNAAERTFRPIVIARKICSGTRSDKGSLTKTTLLSLFVTWQLRGIDPLHAIPRLLRGHSSLTTAA
jgi:transposase